jgi:4-carboxymuconolactone decarboxylase
MARVPDLGPEELDDEQRRVAAQIAGTRGGTVRGPFALWLRLPHLAEHADGFGRSLRGGSLERRLYELITLVVARAWSAQYPFWAHARHAGDVGLTPEVVEAIRTRRPPPFARDDERLVYALATELLETRDLAQASYERALAAFGLERTIEIVTTVGYYAMIAMVVKAFDAPVPSGERPLE